MHLRMIKMHLKMIKMQLKTARKHSHTYMYYFAVAVR